MGVLAEKFLVSERSQALSSLCENYQHVTVEHGDVELLIALCRPSHKMHWPCCSYCVRQQGGGRIYRNNSNIAFLGFPLVPGGSWVFWDIVPHPFLFLGENVLPPDTVRGGSTVDR